MTNRTLQHLTTARGGMNGQATLLIGAAILIAFLVMPSHRPGRFGLVFGEAGLMSLSFLTALALAFVGAPAVNG